MTQNFQVVAVVDFQAVVLVVQPVLMHQNLQTLEGVEVVLL
jgi:hypothetical protein